MNPAEVGTRAARAARAEAAHRGYPSALAELWASDARLARLRAAIARADEAIAAWDGRR